MGSTRHSPTFGRDAGYRGFFVREMDSLLTGLLAVLSIAIGWRQAEALGLGVDLLACLLAWLSVRWNAARIVLGAVLLVYLTAPSSWVELGQLAPLIPILGDGMHGSRRRRAWTSGGYLVVLATLALQDYGSDILLAMLAILIWGAWIVAVWVIGDLFAALRRSQAQERDAALTQQRISFARDLHDTAARTLAVAIRTAEFAHHRNAPDAFIRLLGEARKASSELRWALRILREPHMDLRRRSEASLLHESVSRARWDLEARGFPTSVTIEGDLESIPAPLGKLLTTALGETTANVERHGAPARPCSVIVTVDSLAAELVVINQVEHNGGPAGADSEVTGDSMGLLILKESLAQHGGELDARREGTTWFTHMKVPLHDP